MDLSSLMNNQYITVTGLENMKDICTKNRKNTNFWSFVCTDTVVITIGKVSTLFNGVTYTIYGYPEEDPIIDIHKTVRPTIIMSIDGADVPINKVASNNLSAYIEAVPMNMTNGYIVNMTQVISKIITSVIYFGVSILSMSVQRSNITFDVESLVAKLKRSKSHTDSEFLEADIQADKGVDKKRFSRFWTRDERTKWQAIALNAITTGASNIKEYLARDRRVLDV